MLCSGRFHLEVLFFLPFTRSRHEAIKDASAVTLPLCRGQRARAWNAGDELATAGRVRVPVHGTRVSRWFVKMRILKGQNYRLVLSVLSLVSNRDGFGRSLLKSRPACQAASMPANQPT